jgi:predicted DNA-binding transcriptional regulator AlpA
MGLCGEKAMRTFDDSRAMRPSFTLPEWCQYRKLSRSMFYKLAAQGRAPKTHYIGTRRLISGEADAEWLAAREAESTGAPAAA